MKRLLAIGLLCVALPCSAQRLTQSGVFGVQPQSGLDLTSLINSIVGSSLPGGAYAFEIETTSNDAAANYATLPTSASLQATTAVSIFLWVKMHRAAATWYGLFDQGPGDGNCGNSVFAHALSGHLYFGVNGATNCTAGTGTRADFTFYSWPLNQWFRLAFVYDKITARIYMNGRLVATSASFTTDINTNSNSTLLGVSYDVSTGANAYARACQCTIDDFRYYKNVAATANQILVDYNGGFGQSTDTIGSVSVWLKADDCMAGCTTNPTTLTDSSGNAVDAPITGTEGSWVKGIAPQ